jgi:hypothetical protein
MKRIVICYDGTGNRASGVEWRKKIESNVVRIYAAVPGRRLDQVADLRLESAPPSSAGPETLKWYSEGVGAHTGDRIAGGGFGLTVGDKVKEGLKILEKHYALGDEIYIFGFSRGAYTANLLAHALAETKFGDETGIRVKVLGVWEIVPAVGLPFKALDGLNRKLFTDVEKVKKLPANVEHAFHALAIDEWRLNYEPVVWADRSAAAKVEQRWFVGCHSDVGGGYPDEVKNDEGKDYYDASYEPPEAGDPPRANALSRISLRWMQEHAALDGRGLAFATVPGPVGDDELAKADPRDPYRTMAKGSYKDYMEKTVAIKQFIDSEYKKDLQRGDGPERGRYYRPILTRGSAAGEDLHPSVRDRVRATGGRPYRPENRVAGPGGDRKLWEYLTRG